MLKNCDKLFAKLLNEDQNNDLLATIQTTNQQSDETVVNNSLVKDDITKSEEEHLENKVVSYVCSQLISHVNDLKEEETDEEAKAYLDIVKQKYLKLLVGEYNKL